MLSGAYRQRKNWLWLIPPRCLRMCYLQTANSPPPSRSLLSASMRRLCFPPRWKGSFRSQGAPGRLGSDVSQPLSMRELRRQFWKALVAKKRSGEGRRLQEKRCGTGPAAPRGPKEKAGFCPPTPPLPHLQHLHDLCAPAGAAHGPDLNALVPLRTQVVRSCLYAPTVQVSVHLQDG